MSDDNTRPVSVAELLARNGAIGSPPVGGHRRRKRRNAVSVAELTGEIPVIRDGPEQAESVETSDAEVSYEAVEYETVQYEEPVEYAEAQYETVEYAEAVEYAESTVVYTDSDDGSAVDAYADASVVDGTPVFAEESDTAYVGSDVAYTEAVEAAPQYSDDLDDTPYADVTPDDAEAVAAIPVAEQRTEPRLVAARPPRSSIPLPRRRRGPERGHDPRPRRRSSGAEQMSFDPVDESVDLAELVAEQAPAAEELRSYLRSSSATLFSGDTVADDMARRGEVVEAPDDDAGYDGRIPADRDAAPRRGAVRVLGTSLVAVGQSLFFFVFGAGLFIAFDQLWRWNEPVAVALSTLVVLALVVAVHVIRKTEDIVSILIAVAVGIFVTFGPLALQST